MPLYVYRITKSVIEGGWFIYMVVEMIIYAATQGGGYLFEYTNWTLARSGYWYSILDDTAMNLLIWFSLFGCVIDSILTWQLFNYMEELEFKGFV